MGVPFQAHCVLPRNGGQGIVRDGLLRQRPCTGSVGLGLGLAATLAGTRPWHTSSPLRSGLSWLFCQYLGAGGLELKPTEQGPGQAGAQCSLGTGGRQLMVPSKLSGISFGLWDVAASQPAASQSPSLGVVCFPENLLVSAGKMCTTAGGHVHPLPWLPAAGGL